MESEKKTPRDIQGTEGRNRNEKKCSHGPMDFAETLKLRFRVGDLDVPKKEGGIPVDGRRRK